MLISHNVYIIYIQVRKYLWFHFFLETKAKGDVMTETLAQAKKLISASCLSIHQFQPLSLHALLPENLGMAHNRRSSEVPEGMKKADI